MNDLPEEQSQPNLSAAEPVELVPAAGAAPVDMIVFQPTVGKKTFWSAFALLVDAKWLKNTFKIVFAFAPGCILPAALFTIAYSSVFFGLFNAVKQLTVPQVQIQNIMTGTIIMLIAAVIYLVCVLWSFGLWLVRLNTFCRAYCNIDARNNLTKLSANEDWQPLTPTLLKSLFESAHKFTLERKKYLAKFYLLVSTISVIPIVLFFIVVTIKLLMLGVLSPMVPKIDFPPIAHIAVTIVLVAVSAYGLALMPTSIIISSLSTRPASVAAWACIKLTLIKLLPLTCMIAIVGIVQTLITSPQVFLQPSNLLSTEIPVNNIWPTIGSIVWGGVTSVLLITLMLTPFCEMLKDGVE